MSIYHTITTVSRTFALMSDFISLFFISHQIVGLVGQVNFFKKHVLID